MKNRQHSLIEDCIAIVTAAFVVSQGIFFLQHGGLLTGGTTGVALLASQFVDVSFGTLYFLFNSPFYVMAWFRMSKSFAITSLISGGLVSIMVDHIPGVIEFSSLNPLYCAVIGGILAGVGMLMLFRHQTSLGGFNVLCLYCQEKFGIPAGKIQMAIDCTILLASFFMLTPIMLGYSIVGAVVLNLILTMNHKPGRYDAKPMLAGA